MIYFLPYLFYLGLVVNSAYLSYKYYDFYFAGNYLAMANCADNCDSVMTSKYALVMGIPLPFFGLAFFIAWTLIYAILHYKSKDLANSCFLRSKFIFELMTALAVIAAGTFLYLLYFDLHLFCKFCTISHVLSLGLALYYLLFLRKKFLQ